MEMSKHGRGLISDWTTTPVTIIKMIVLDCVFELVVFI